MIGIKATGRETVDVLHLKVKEKMEMEINEKERKGKGNTKAKAKAKAKTRPTTAQHKLRTVEIRKTLDAWILIRANATLVMVASTITPLSIVQISFGGNTHEETRVGGGAPFKKAKPTQLRQPWRQGPTQKAKFQAIRSKAKGQELERRPSGTGVDGRSAC